MADFSLNDLAATIAERAASGSAESYTVRLLGTGRSGCARKFGEEAVETIIAALDGDADALTAEVADVLYHLLVLLRSADVPLEKVMANLAARTQQGGLAEKASRPAR
jgi:phosphoribosyl-ATP pyrophosphohydrolase